MLKQTGERTDIRSRMRHDFTEKSIFNKAGDYSFDYLDSVAERVVYPEPEALKNLGVFEENFPGEPGCSHQIIDLLHQYGSPATIAQIAGRYFGMVNGGIIPVTLGVKWLTDTWDQNTPLYVTSPIVSVLEAVVEKWLKQIFSLPDSTVAGFVSGTSMAILCGLAAARYRIYGRLNWNVNEKGLHNAPEIRIVAGRHSHGTVLKALALLGFGLENIEWVEVDKHGRIIPELIPETDDKTILILQAGNVNSGAFDDFTKICKKVSGANTWIHIDGAFGLWAAGSERLKYLTRGIEYASSWSVDGHKTLNTPYDSGVILCNDREALVSALQASGSYIIYGLERDGMLYTPEMSRRARAVELWAALKYLGREGIDQLVYGLHERAVQFAEELSSAGFEILNEVFFNQVLVACKNDDLTERTLGLIQKSGECWCGGSTWFSRKVIRISVCSWATTSSDVTRSVRAFTNAKKEAERL